MLRLKFNKGVASLLWVVFTDSLGWGIAFSVFAALFFDKNAAFLSSTLTDSSRYMLYELTLAIYSVFMFLFAPVIGGISDRYGRKPGLILSMLGLMSGFILSALGCYWSSLSILLIGRIISGMTAGSLSVAQAAVVDISTPKNKSFYLSLLILANCLGFSLGPVLGAMFVNSGTFPVGTMTFLVGAVMSLAGLMGILFCFKETYKPQKTDTSILNDFLNIKVAFYSTGLNKYLLAFLLSMVAYGLFFSYIPIFLHQQFLVSTQTTSYVLSSLVLFLSFSLLIGGKFIFSTFEKTRSMMAIFLVQLSAYAMLGLGISSFLFNCFLFACVSFSVGLMYIGLLTMISDATEQNWQGRIMGVIASISSLTWGLGPVLSGSLNNIGSGTGFLFAALLMGGGIWAFRLSQHRTNRSLADTTT